MGVVGGAAGTGSGKRHVEPVVCDGLTGINGHVVPCSHAHVQVARSEGVHGNEVVGNHRHGVAYDGDREAVVYTGVDEPEKMSFPRCQHDFGILSPGPVGVDIGAVEKDV